MYVCIDMKVAVKFAVSAQNKPKWNVNFRYNILLLQIAAIVYSRQSRVSFDKLWFDDQYEKVILVTQGSKITPLVVNPGRILLTSSRLYFQPYNNVESVSWCVIWLAPVVLKAYLDEFLFCSTTSCMKDLLHYYKTIGLMLLNKC
jgi:hypothetical protein